MAKDVPGHVRRADRYETQVVGIRKAYCPKCYRNGNLGTYCPNCGEKTIAVSGSIKFPSKKASRKKWSEFIKKMEGEHDR